MFNKLKYMLVLLVILSSIGFSQTNFEGKVVFQVKSDNNEINKITYLIKGDKFRIEPEAKDDSRGKGVMVYDSKNKMMTMFITERKMYMEMPFDLTDKTETVKKEKTESYFKNTGKTKKIHGYICENFEFENKGKKGEAWMTKELGGFLFFRNPRQKPPTESDWKSAIIAENYFPMEISEIKDDGTANVMFEVLELKAENLKNSLFEPPAGYQKFDMSKMMNLGK